MQRILQNYIVFIMLLCVGVLTSSFTGGVKVPVNKSYPRYKFKYERSHGLKGIPESSDIVFDSATNHLFIVSDHGKLFECDLEGNIIRKAADEGLDFEGVEVTDSFVYVSDETPRKVYKYLKSDLSLRKIYGVTWGGAMNKAFESITYNKTKKCWILISEAPAVIIEYDNDFKELDRYKFPFTRDVSGARWYNGFLYIVANKDETIFKCDADSYKIEAAYKVDIQNPEGITFDRQGNADMVSDDLQRIYFFKNLPQNNN